MALAATPIDTNSLPPPRQSMGERGWLPVLSRVFDNSVMGVMRVLAILSALGLIPAVVGGLLGMNVAGNPWVVTLPQVVYCVSVGMSLALYLFLIKGWLR